MANIYQGTLGLIGNTPLVEVTNIEKELGLEATVLVKLEYFNPAGSVKDRIAKAMIEDAEAKGQLKESSVIIEPTSGNTGIGLASIAAAKGYRIILTMPETMSVERRNILKAYGAELVLTEGAKGMKGAIAKAEELAKEIPGSFIPGQFVNPANPAVHKATTGPEIWKQTNGKVTHFFACSGTGGTISGIGKYLKEQNPAVEVIGVDAVGSILKKYKETGIVDPNELQPYRMEGVGKNMIPSATDFSVIDRFVKVNDFESAHVARMLPLIEGLMCGYSSGAALAAVIKELEHLPADAVPVVLLPDHGERYMTKVFDDRWMQAQEWLNGFTPVVKDFLLELKNTYGVSPTLL